METVAVAGSPAIFHRKRRTSYRSRSTRSISVQNSPGRWGVLCAYSMQGVPVASSTTRRTGTWPAQRARTCAVSTGTTGRARAASTRPMTIPSAAQAMMLASARVQSLHMPRLIRYPQSPQAGGGTIPRERPVSLEARERHSPDVHPNTSRDPPDTRYMISRSRPTPGSPPAAAGSTFTSSPRGFGSGPSGSIPSSS